MNYSVKRVFLGIGLGLFLGLSPNGLVASDKGPSKVSFVEWLSLPVAVIGTALAIHKDSGLPNNLKPLVVGVIASYVFYIGCKQGAYEKNKSLNKQLSGLVEDLENSENPACLEYAKDLNKIC